MVRELEDKDNARRKELEKARTDKTDALTEQRDKHEVAVLSVRPHACTPDAPLDSGSWDAFPGHKSDEQCSPEP